MMGMNIISNNRESPFFISSTSAIRSQFLKQLMIEMKTFQN